MPKLVALFSGQGAQYPGMGKELCENFASARAVYECAGDILGFDVRKMSFEGSEEELARTRTAQPAIFTLSMAAYAAVGNLLPAPCAVAGHSLGEFAALCCAGVYTLEEGLRIIAARAAAMDAVKTGGAMYAVIGGTSDEVEAPCREISGLVLPVNYNLPGQTVISGEEQPAAAAAALLEESGKKVIRLAVSGAFHTEMMAPAAKQLREAVSGIKFCPAEKDFYANLTGKREIVEDFPDYFARHMVSPVRFVEEVGAMVADGIEVCVEFGPGRAASTLVKKNARALSVGNVEDLKSLDKAAALFA